MLSLRTLSYSTLCVCVCVCVCVHCVHVHTEMTLLQQLYQYLIVVVPRVHNIKGGGVLE